MNLLLSFSENVCLQIRGWFYFCWCKRQTSPRVKASLPFLIHIFIIPMCAAGIYSITK